MGRETIRQDLTTAVKNAVDQFASWAVAVEYDNRIVVNTAEHQDPFLCVEIKFTDAEQRDLAPDSAHRYSGFLILSVAVKEGSGTSKANQLLDFLVTRLHRKAHGSVRTLMADIAPQRPHLGWVYYPMLIPFWSDQAG